MSNIKLDLKSFKHVKSDDKTTTLRHDDGHEIKLAHKSLSKEGQAQLRALAGSAKRATDDPQERAMMAEGGEASAPSITPDIASQLYTTDPEQAAPAIQQAYDTGVTNEIKSNKGKAALMRSALEKDRPFVEPASDQQNELDALNMTKDHVDQMTADNKPAADPAVQGDINAQKRALGLMAPEAQGIAPGAAPQASAAPQGDGLAQGMDATAGMMQAGYNNQMKGIQDTASAQGKLGEAQAQLMQQNIEAQQHAQGAFKSQFDALEQERQAHMQDIKDGHIDPNKYWTGDKDGNGSHSKIAAGIGMILAGFNPTNNPNAAINFLKSQMDMNLEAQKQNLGAKQNLLSANLRQFGNLKDATDMTRLMQADVMHNQLMQAAATAQTPMAKAAAEQAAGKLQMEYAPIQQQFAMRRAMMGLANNGAKGDPTDTKAAEQMISYARMTNPEMAKEMESRLIPGVGMAKLPIPNEARTEITAKQSLDHAAQDLMQYSKTHTNLIPGTAEYTYGEAKALAFQQKVREGLLGTVFRESEKPLLEKFVKDNPAGAMKSLSTQPQLRSIIDSNNMSLNALKQSYGLPQTKTQSAPQFATKNGVKYQKVDGGWAKVK